MNHKISSKIKTDKVIFKRSLSKKIKKNQTNDINRNINLKIILQKDIKKKYQ